MCTCTYYLLAPQGAVYGAPLLLSLLGQRGDDGEAELAASFALGLQQLDEPAAAEGGSDSGGGGGSGGVGVCGGAGGGKGSVGGAAVVAARRARLVAFDFHAQCKPSRADGLRALVPQLPTLAVPTPYDPLPPLTYP